MATELQTAQMQVDNGSRQLALAHSELAATGAKAAHAEHKERQLKSELQSTRKLLHLAAQQATQVATDKNTEIAELHKKHVAALAERNERIVELEKALPAALAKAEQLDAQRLTPQRPHAPSSASHSVRKGSRISATNKALLAQHGASGGGTPQHKQGEEGLRRIQEIKEIEAQTLQAFTLEQTIAKELQLELAQAVRAEAQTRKEMEQRLVDLDARHQTEIDATRQHFEKASETAGRQRDEAAQMRLTQLKLQSQMAEQSERAQQQHANEVARHTAQVEKIVEEVEREKQQSNAKLSTELHAHHSAATRAQEAHQAAVSQMAAKEKMFQEQLESTRTGAFPSNR